MAPSNAFRPSRAGSSAARATPVSRARSRTNITTSPESRPPYVDSSKPKRVSCGALTAADAGAYVELNGWVHRRRDHGGLIFIDVRDRSGITQVTLHPAEAGGVGAG